MEFTRANRRFMLGYAGAAPTGIQSVTALPTTQPQWAIWNADPARSYFFEELGVYFTGGTTGVGGILLGCIFSAPIPTGSNAANINVSSFGKPGGVAGSSQGSAAIVKSSPSAITTPAAPNWFVIASSDSPNSGLFPIMGRIERRDLAGAIAIAPGMGLGLAVVAPAGTAPLFAPIGRWVEAETDME
jgi:hypothetical protein